MDDEILDYETSQFERSDELNTDDEDDLMTDNSDENEEWRECHIERTSICHVLICMWSEQ